ncbi:flavin reductase family protein [Actinoplanes sp. NPDC026619]|uniref:flavin reductase family protein n=1 Tax=Actinoplanes sp. NPDC026619 TaxID=3155798 RepID=UPI0033F93F23
MTVGAREFRDAMACLAMPVAVVSMVDADGGWHGATLGSVVSLSLDPPLVMFAVGRGTRVHRPLCGSERFCISILGAGQRAAAEQFAGAATGRFATGIVPIGGIPAVSGAACWLLCGRSRLVEAGDHTIVIGQVDDVRQGPRGIGGPLVYHGRRYHQLGTLSGAEQDAELGSSGQAELVVGVL